MSLRLLPLLFLLGACTDSKEAVSVYTEIWDGNGDGRINPGEKVAMDVFIEDTEETYVYLDNVRFRATLRGNLLDFEDTAVESVSCENEDVDLTYGPTSCRLDFTSVWVDATL